MNPSVAFFTSLRARGEPRPIVGLLEQIRTGAWASVIARLRSEQDPAKAARLKKALPAFTASACGNGGRKAADMRTHTGLLQGDIDKIGRQQAEHLREALRAEPCTFAAWISPSGDGLKLLVRVPADLANHAASFAAAELHFRERWQIKLDSHCKDVARLCFVSHDPGLWINEGAEALAVEGETRATVSELPTPSIFTASVTVSESVSMQQAEKRPRQFASAELAKLYHSLVRCRVGTVQLGSRNAHLCELAPFLFSAVGEQVAFSFMEAFHRENESTFNDPLAATMKEARALLAGMASRYGASLSTEARALYATLPAPEQAAFRICRALSALDSEELPPGTFFISCANLAARIGGLSMQAHRILGGFMATGILSLIQKGTRRAKGEQGMASTYRFLPG